MALLCFINLPYFPSQLEHRVKESLSKIEFILTETFFVRGVRFKHSGLAIKLLLNLEATCNEKLANFFK